MTETSGKEGVDQLDDRPDKNEARFEEGWDRHATELKNEHIDELKSKIDSLKQELDLIESNQGEVLKVNDRRRREEGSESKSAEDVALEKEEQIREAERQLKAVDRGSESVESSSSEDLRRFVLVREALEVESARGSGSESRGNRNESDSGDNPDPEGSGDGPDIPDFNPGERAETAPPESGLNAQQAEAVGKMWIFGRRASEFLAGAAAGMGLRSTLNSLLPGMVAGGALAGALVGGGRVTFSESRRIWQDHGNELDKEREFVGEVLSLRDHSGDDMEKIYEAVARADFLIEAIENARENSQDENEIRFLTVQLEQAEQHERYLRLALKERLVDQDGSERLSLTDKIDFLIDQMSESKRGIESEIEELESRLEGLRKDSYIADRFRAHLLAGHDNWSFSEQDNVMGVSDHQYFEQFNEGLKRAVSDEDVKQDLIRRAEEGISNASQKISTLSSDQENLRARIQHLEQEGHELLGDLETEKRESLLNKIWTRMDRKKVLKAAAYGAVFGAIGGAASAAVAGFFGSVSDSAAESVVERPSLDELGTDGSPDTEPSTETDTDRDVDSPEDVEEPKEPDSEAEAESVSGEEVVKEDPYPSDTDQGEVEGKDPESKLSVVESVPDTVALESGDNTWKVAKTQLAELLGREPTNAEVLKVAKELAQSSDVAVPEWGLNSGTDQHRLPVGYELRFTDSVKAVMADIASGDAGVESVGPVVEPQTLTEAQIIEPGMEVEEASTTDGSSSLDNVPQAEAGLAGGSSNEDLPDLSQTPVMEGGESDFTPAAETVSEVATPDAEATLDLKYFDSLEAFSDRLNGVFPGVGGFEFLAEPSVQDLFQNTTMGQFNEAFIKSEVANALNLGQPVPMDKVFDMTKVPDRYSDNLQQLVQVMGKIRSEGPPGGSGFRLPSRDMSASLWSYLELIAEMNPGASLV